MVQPSAYSQYMLELINRARLDPATEADLYGIDLTFCERILLQSPKDVGQAWEMNRTEQRSGLILST